VRVAIAGGHGKVAIRLARLLGERGDEVRSLIRKPEHSDDVREAGAEPVVCDLESASEDQAAEAAGSVDAVVFAAGAGPGSGTERKWTVDYGGAVKLITAAKANDVRRYVMVSSIGADPSREGEDTFSVYLRAKGKADENLQASGLDYTVVRPAGLTDDPGTGRVRIAERVGRGKVSRDDIAAVLAATLHQPGTAGLTFEVKAGDVPVDEAVAAIAGGSATPS
jgi:nucleoside-diphosphate-sugar epimerase